MMVREMPTREQPAERLRLHGAEALTTEELITVALGLTSTVTARALVERSGGELRRLTRMPRAALKLVEGLGDARVTQLLAIGEFARRWCAQSDPDRKPIKAPRDVVAATTYLSELEHEEFHILALDSQHRLIRDVLITRGVLNSSLVHPREVFKQAILESAAAVICVHNHPSGDPTPSADDTNATEQIVAAGRLLDMPVHDHVIIGRGGRYCSFAEAGLL